MNIQSRSLSCYTILSQVTLKESAASNFKSHIDVDTIVRITSTNRGKASKSDFDLSYSRCSTLKNFILKHINVSSFQQFNLSYFPFYLLSQFPSILTQKNPKSTWVKK